ncbi:hypothetical protein [Pseudazoarcus pumilus]|uniref:Uncharacterized protein n=1 Tax=Pseudazoarcus pumilus TaxID=2067960 RepID=A0A2I6S7U7_9RHOO|nr:hypothetical protein [Pseudazoarcus pumilus]AUN95317.1 hypothetical protein C0099_10485 [Pseudazoarcus pumilus]
MKPANVRLQIHFDLQLAVPDELATMDPQQLKARLAEMLGAMVLQGLPTIAGKQLARAGVELRAHAHAIQATALSPTSSVERDELVTAAPHLTDAELEGLVARAGHALPEAASDRLRALRRHGLAIANEFRLVPCVVHAMMSNEQPGTLEASLNLTNGSVMIEAHERSKRLLAGQEDVAVEIAGVDEHLPANYAGHTISGPVIEVTVAEISRHRDALLGLWQQGA